MPLDKHLPPFKEAHEDGDEAAPDSIFLETHDCKGRVLAVKSSRPINESSNDSCVPARSLGSSWGLLGVPGGSWGFPGVPGGSWGGFLGVPGAA